MKGKIFIFIVGVLVGAIIASACFLILGGKGKAEKRDFDPSKFKNEEFTPPSDLPEDFDFKNFDKDKLPQKEEE